VVEWTTSGWSQLGDDIVHEDELFGTVGWRSIDLDHNGTVLVLGAPDSWLGEAGATSAGHVRAFQLSAASEWVPLGADLEGSNGENFGLAISLSANGQRCMHSDCWC
jgi:hypothetical protein